MSQIQSNEQIFSSVAKSGNIYFAVIFKFILIIKICLMVLLAVLMKYERNKNIERDEKIKLLSFINFFGGKFMWCNISDNLTP